MFTFKKKYIPAPGKSVINLNALLFVILIATILFTGCAPDANPVSSEKTPTLQELYETAILDAVVADSNEICTTLVAISPVNTTLSWRGSGDSASVLVVTWTKYIASYPLGDTVNLVWGETWVTVPYEFKQWCQKHNPNPDSALRIEQLLGLPAGKGYTHFAELWVHPSDLFRPAPDCEITDNRAELTLQPGADSTYAAWYKANILNSYFPPRFPWTRLGYTYDWGNSQSEIGLSEFVIRKNAKVIVNATYTSSAYVKLH
jgi:hypothetical protein